MRLAVSDRSRSIVIEAQVASELERKSASTMKYRSLNSAYFQAGRLSMRCAISTSRSLVKRKLCFGSRHKCSTHNDRNGARR
jgi:hypothetical protein